MGLISSLAEKVKLRLLSRDQYESLPLRRWFADAFEIEVGLYSYGCFDRWRIADRTRIGRYCSFARTARVLDANHPMTSMTTHPYLYDSGYGIVPADLIDPPWIVIEDDVWVSHGVIITPGCKHIGRGAVIGAGAIVTKDVPAYAIVAGAPAKVIRYRFEPELQAALEASRWWELDKAELAEIGRTDPDLLLHPTIEKLAALAARPRKTS